MLADPETGQYFKRFKWLFLLHHLVGKIIYAKSREREREETRKRVSKRSAAIKIKKGDPVEGIWRGVIGT